MQSLQSEPVIADYRVALMRFLNEFGLDATAILSLVRRTELVEYEPRDVVLKQGGFDTYVYFLVSGDIVILLSKEGREEVLGERTPVTVLGEISFFNKTPATATVAVKDGAPATFLRISYDQFNEVISEYPQIETTLGRIGELRVISQMSGFTSYVRFMEMIGWKRDRLVVNRALYPHLVEAIAFRLLPLLQPGSRILEVGDGPGIICDIIRDHQAEATERLFLQATHLEDAILHPLQSFPSDFSRAKYLRERFEGIVTLQVFERVKADGIGEQFEHAARLLKPEGVLMVVHLAVVDVGHVIGTGDTFHLFRGVEELVRRTWPEMAADEPLISVTFLDADIDPMMEWSQGFCDRVVRDDLHVPTDVNGKDQVLLEVLLRQARRRVFNPEEMNFHWLVWHAAHHGLTLEDSHQNPEDGFFYQLYRRAERR